MTRDLIFLVVMVQPDVYENASLSSDGLQLLNVNMVYSHTGLR